MGDQPSDPKGPNVRCFIESPARDVREMAKKIAELEAKLENAKHLAESLSEQCEEVARLKGKLEAAEHLKEKTVTLCGSTRFKASYIDWLGKLTDEGWVVLSVGRFLPRQRHNTELKATLDEVHLRKIEMSGGIFVLDVNGYIGESTQREIAHAEKLGLHVRYLSVDFPWYKEPELSALLPELEAAEREREEEREKFIDLLHAVSRFIGSDEDGQEMYNELVAVWERVSTVATDGDQDG